MTISKIIHVTTALLKTVTGDTLMEETLYRSGIDILVITNSSEIPTLKWYTAHARFVYARIFSDTRLRYKKVESSTRIKQFRNV